jgi:mono/diheme cytochrome c family protein
MRLKPPQQPAKAVINHTGWINIMRKNTLAYSCLPLVLAVPMPSIADNLVELRPNDPVYVKLGQKIYMDKCASCHGVNLEGQDGWRDKMVDGMRLAPPHDKSGHTWHHPDALLFKLTKYGFAAMISSDYKVSMPIYDDVLKDEEIVAALSYIKSTWPDDVRQIQDKINADYKLNNAMENSKSGS